MSAQIEITLREDGRELHIFEDGELKYRKHGDFNLVVDDKSGLIYEAASGLITEPAPAPREASPEETAELLQSETDQTLEPAHAAADGTDLVETPGSLAPTDGGEDEGAGSTPDA